MNRLTGDKGFIPILSLVLAVLFLLPHMALGATAPEAVKILTLSGLSTPGIIAADGYGNIYVADTYSNVVKSYNSRGVQTGTIKPSNKVSALAVSPDNLLYAGEVRNHSTEGLIEVFNHDGSLIRTINHDVTQPGAMAFLSTGEMYFVSGCSVKKFDSGLNNITLQFGGNTGAQGSMVAPSAIAIKEATDASTGKLDTLKSEIYVLDYGFITAKDKAYGASNIVWRVQVFALDGTYLRAFSNYSFAVEGSIGSASGMALDNQGRVYVSDNIQNIIAVYDSNGNPITTMSPVINPVNLYFTNDRLYVVSKKSAVSSKVGSAEVYGIDSFASISANPLSLSYAYQNGAAAQTRSLVISNTGSGALSWQAAFTSAQGQWLTISDGSGQVAGKSDQTITATINEKTASSLAIGTYTGNIQLLSNGGTENISVKLDVVGAPVLAVTPPQFNKSKTLGTAVDPLNVAITITNDSSGTLTWLGTPTVDWLSIKAVTSAGSQENNLTSSTTSSQITVSADPAKTVNMAPGVYTGTIVITADGAVGSPATITVTLVVIESNKINVTTNTPDASFTITGPEAFTAAGTGQNYTAAGLKPGDYTIVYAPIKGFKIPASETQNLVSGELNFAGEYIDLRKQVNIIASNGGCIAGRADCGEVIVFTAKGAAVKSIAAFAGVHGVNTATGDIDGDGSADIIVSSDNAIMDSAGAVASGGMSKKAAIVKGFDADGIAISGAAFKAMTSARSGVTVASGDFDGDGIDEIVTGTTNGSTIIKVFTYNKGSVADSGIYLEAYPGNGGGVNVAVADLDGDGIAELVSSPVKNDGGPAEIKVFKIDTSAGPGNWRAVPMYKFDGCGGAAVSRLALGDIDADGAPEIIAVCTVEDSGSEIREYKASGQFIRSFEAGTRADSVAAGDTNMDGTAEIILGDAPGRKLQSVRILDAETGTTIRTFRAFTESTGVNVSVGNLGY